MFKKIASLLFEEEEEILEEVVAEPKPKKASVISTMNPPLKEKAVEVKKVVEAKVEEPKPLSEEKIRSNFGITADDPEDSDDLVEPVRVVKAPNNPSPQPKRQVYDFHPVISPIFGVKESLHKDTAPRVIPDAQPILPKSVINTVISPIYGDMESTSEIKHVSMDDLHAPTPQKPFAREPFKTQTIEEKPVVTKEHFERMDLDALLNTLSDEDDQPLKPTDPMPILDEDAHQFTLFDDLEG